MSELEPRVSQLERLNSDQNAALKAMQNDLHHISNTFKSMEKTFEKLVEVSYRVEGIKETAIRAHKRIDDLEIRLAATATDFTHCRASKLEKGDLKGITEKIDTLTKDVTEIKIQSASHAWVSKLVWALVSGFIAAGFMYMQMRG